MAQSQPQNLPGYVVTTKGDTLRGFLSVPRFVTENGFLYRAAAQAAPQTFTTQEVRAFGLQDGRRFVRRTMAVRQNIATGAVDSATVFLQHLIAGAANFYRYDPSRRRSSTEAGLPVTEEFYLSMSSHNLVQVRRATQEATLSALFKDCPAVVAAVPRTLFDEYKLGNLVMRYNTECHATTPAHDYRLPHEPSSVHLLVSLRAGAQQGQLFYTASDDLTQANTYTATLPVYGLELRLANKGPWSLIAGVHYTTLRSEATHVQPAQLGATNTGESLRLPFRVEVQSLQAPVLVRYTVGRQMLLRPYVAAGALLGMYMSNQTTLSYTTLTRVGTSTTTPYRNDVVTESVENPKSNSPTVGVAVRIGLQFKTKARISPMLEAQYSAGNGREDNPGLRISSFTGVTENLGRLHYQAVGLLLGLEF